MEVNESSSRLWQRETRRFVPRPCNLAANTNMLRILPAVPEMPEWDSEARVCRVEEEMLLQTFDHHRRWMMRAKQEEGGLRGVRMNILMR
jgi:hypothetical protein